MGKTVEYTNGEVTVIWEPERCMHSGICFSLLPEVYKPKERPWINPENCSTEKFIEQIGMCPSAALSYRMNNEKKEE